MSKVFNMVGGGGNNVSAIIITGLASTDTITCTKDGKSYTATWSETAQHWEIVGLPLGTFTITATNGTKTITETVLIDIAGVYDIEIFLNRLYLYRAGDECEDVTGGIIQYEYAYSAGSTAVTPQKNSDNLQLFCESSQSCEVRTNNKIDLSGHSKLCVDYMSVFTDDTNGKPVVAVSEYISTYLETMTKLLEVKDIYSLTRTIAEIDISSIDKSAYIFLSVVGGRKAYVYNVWLER